MVVNPVLSAVAKVHRGADEHLSTAEAPDSYTGYPELLLFHYIALVKSGLISFVSFECGVPRL